MNSSASLRIVYVGSLMEGGTCRMRQDALRDLGHEVHGLDVDEAQRGAWCVPGMRRVAPRWDAGFRRINHLLKKMVTQLSPEVIWVDKGTYLFPQTLGDIRQSSNATWVHYNPDDPFGGYRRNWEFFIKGAALYDVHFVPRPQNIAEYQALGCRYVFEFDRGFNRELHKPTALSNEERERYAAAVGFVGTWAAARGESVAFLARRKAPLSIRGNEWKECPQWPDISPYYRGPSILGQEYVKAICGLDIALHFLRHENRDAQDSRTFEIPACGAFMLAERSAKHLEVFHEGKEAEFFSSNEELLDKVNYYLSHPEQRRRIAASGRQRCLDSGYSYHDRLSNMLNKMQRVRAARD